MEYTDIWLNCQLLKNATLCLVHSYTAIESFTGCTLYTLPLSFLVLRPRQESGILWMFCVCWARTVRNLRTRCGRACLPASALWGVSSPTLTSMTATRSMF